MESSKLKVATRIKDFSDKDSCNLFFDWLNDLTTDLNLSEESEQLALNVRNDNRKRFSVNLNSRLVLGLTNVNAELELMLMVYKKDLNQIQNYRQPGDGDYFAKGEEKALVVLIPIKFITQQAAPLKRLWLACCKDYAPLAVKSRYRKHNIPLLYTLAKDKNAREDIYRETENVSPVVKSQPEYFLKREFDLLTKFQNVEKKESSDEHRSAYKELSKTYAKVDYWAEQVKSRLFKDGVVDIRRKPTTQANRFCDYLWAKIYPDKISRIQKHLAYTVSIADGDVFHVKIDTVLLDEKDERRKAYIKYRGDFTNSAIVKIFPAREFLQLDWDDLIDETVEAIKSLEGDFEKMRAIIFKTNTSISMTESTTKPVYPLNQILFGPPGTGKTYNTINKALEIIGERIEGKSRQEIKELFDAKVKDGQIVFTTFHQSMSYEDFIEGIKPLKPLPDDKFVKFDIQPGIFYTICETAKSNYENAKAENKEKLSFEEAFEKFKDAWEQNPDMKFPLKTDGFDFTVIGFTNTSIQFKKASGGTDHTLSIATLKELYYGKQYNFKQGVGIYYPAVLTKVQSFQNEMPNEVLQEKYVLIIDEINRGNVSQIFGELITLIEPDKRSGNAEEISVTLPYSKTQFSVPLNLYLLGTMNTADRSVEALDTALRRRFSFTEIPAQTKFITEAFYEAFSPVLAKYGDSEWNDEGFLAEAHRFIQMLDETEYNVFKSAVDKVWKGTWGETEYLAALKEANLEPITSKILNTINKRIERLLDKDHQIGHAYLMSSLSLPDLKTTFTKNILPLLQEYFYGNPYKIGMVLGSEFVSEDKGLGREKFATGFNRADDFEVKKVYSFTNPDDWTMDTFKSIWSE